MPGTVETLPPLEIEGHQVSNPGTNDDHPMRLMTRRAAGLADPPWDADAAHEVAALFDRLAPEWHTRSSPQRTAVVLDALDRGGVGDPNGVAVELGSGIGAYTGLLQERFGTVMAADLAHDMLALAPHDAPRTRADASQVPVADGTADAVVLVNMFLFPVEVDRILAPGGCVVWVNSSGTSTPIHLLPSEVVDALPGTWHAVSAAAGAGLWAVARRA